MNSVDRSTGAWPVDEYDLESEGVFDKSDEDEDEFGLPSIAHSRRVVRKPSVELEEERHPALEKDLRLFGLGPTRRDRANSSDIAEERGPTYPAMRKNEGKILRPQYKEILKGVFNVQLCCV